MEDIVTYETLYELLRKEKYGAELMEIDKDLYAKAINYLQEKRKLIEAQRGKDTMFADEVIKTQRQLDNAGKILQELYERREGKIFQLAVVSSRVKRKEVPTALLLEERKMYSDLLETLKKYRTGILDNLLAAKKPEIQEEIPKDIKRDFQEASNRIVRFKSPVPQFVAEDLKTYGPFEKEDVATIPTKAASIIINKKRGEDLSDEVQQEST